MCTQRRARELEFQHGGWVDWIEEIVQVDLGYIKRQSANKQNKEEKKREKVKTITLSKKTFSLRLRRVNTPPLPSPTFPSGKN